MLVRIGGVTKAIIPDNLKSAVTESSRHELLINENFAGFGLHYNTHILAIRSRKPRDKALVEKDIRELSENYNKINYFIFLFTDSLPL